MAPIAPSSPSILLRAARMDDIEAIASLIAISARALGTGYYTEAQTEAALGSAFGVDTQLIRDGTYFVATDGQVLAACGGWSYRQTLYGSDREAGRNPAEIDPAHGAARIRAFFVHPQWARQGVASRLLAHCEAEAAARGFRRMELLSTLPGVPFYERRGYVPGVPVQHRLQGGVLLDLLPMSKQVTPAA